MNRKLNIRFPLESSDETKDIFSFDKVSTDSIKSKLILFLTTQRGTRYFFPDYGSNIYNFIFDQNDDTTKDSLVNDLRNSVSRYFKNIRIKNVDIEIDGNTIILSIQFQYSENSLNFIDDITLRFTQ